MPRVLKLVVSVLLLAWLLGTVEWREMSVSFARAEGPPLLIACLILLVQFPVSAWRWSIALSVHDLHWRVLPLLRIGSIAFFLNNFLPTSIGGDVYRAYRTVPGDGRFSAAVSAVLLDRLMGLLALLLLGAAGAAALYVRGPNELTGFLAIVFSLPVAMAAALPAVLRIGWIRGVLGRLARAPKLEPLARNAKQILGRPGRLIYLFGASIVFQAFAVLAIFLLFEAVGQSGLLAEGAVIGATSSIATLLPISINGIGLMEGSFALTAQRVGVDYESAIIVALFLRASMLVISAACAPIFFWDRGRGLDSAFLAQEKAGSA